ncbi:NAD(P)-binding domain-containing protein [Paenibacillus sp. TRM 82003]|uniref:NAD(P)-binding protein n=1 Tax=Kineococcus sp. TRM81007 TaxID=2925831 RepID=UPI001F57806C|nr:NAD(P)-binding protein [Kineococcus sp. TRM81007]MCI2238547.1 NAD(P)-binding domain-containing protein [Kineococcus sp. TRM81007]MCI3921940.1 NAD(P)-binding domain-containing protein [Paenibacillus sp. TRM 82003]
MNTPTGRLPVVVVGAGPVGLAAAAHLLERGLEALVLEAGERVGAAVRQWHHVRLFSPWRYDVDAAAARLLTPTGWEHPEPTGLPTGGDLVERYLEPLAATEALAPRTRTGARVVAVSRVGLDKTRSRGRDERPFLVRVQQAGGTVVDHHARAVIDASGTWGQPNPLGVSGLPALGEDEAAPFLAGPLPDVLGAERDRFAGRRVLVVGAGHSATNTLLNLVALADEAPATRVVWAVRGASVTRSYGGGDLDGLPARGALGARLRDAVESGRVELRTEVTVSALEPRGGEVVVVARTPAGEQRLVVDVIAAATGFRPDLGVLRELRLDLDPGVEAPARLAPLIDPEFHSCGTVPPHGADVLAHPESGFFTAGTKSYGRAPTFLLATGYEQVRSIAAHLAGDVEAAADVRLDLPETGVCSSSTPAVAADGTVEIDESAGGSCCGSTTGPAGAPQPITVGAGPVVGAGAGAGLGFSTGFLRGRSGEASAGDPRATSRGCRG